MSDEEIRKAILAAGVKNLRRFGYPKCTAENILVDQVYKAFFKAVLEDEENITDNADTERVRKQLLRELK